MAIDLESLVSAVSEEQPSGPDLSYDAARTDIESAFERSVSGDDDAADVDWRKTISLIEQQAALTRDIWLPVYLMRAGARNGALDSVEDGAALLAGLFEAQWETVHPQLDEYGFQGRKGPCESLTKLGDFLNPLRRIPLLSHARLGVYAGGDFDRYRKNGDSEEGYGMFRALLQETNDDDLLAIIARLEGIEASIRRADAVLTAHAEGDTGTNFQPTYATLAEMRSGVSAYLSNPPAAVDNNVSDGDGVFDDTPASSSDSVSGGSFGGRINSRDDVIRALDAIADYYVRKEPGSAVPFALRRAREWVSLDFMAILEDIAPGSIDEARRVLMANRSNGDGDYSSGESSDSSW